MKRLYLTASLIIARITLGAVPALAASPEPCVIQDQGSFTAGGTVATAPGVFDPRKLLGPAGQTFHGDHVYAFYQKPRGRGPVRSDGAAASV